MLGRKRNYHAVPVAAAVESMVTQDPPDIFWGLRIQASSKPQPDVEKLGDVCHAEAAIVVRWAPQHLENDEARIRISSFDLFLNQPTKNRSCGLNQFRLMAHTGEKRLRQLAS